MAPRCPDSSDQIGAGDVVAACGSSGQGSGAAPEDDCVSTSPHEGESPSAGEASGPAPVSDHVRSGRYVTAAGIVALKGGVRRARPAETLDAGRKPPWLRVKLPSGPGFERVRGIVRAGKLHTVCAESKCPNILNNAGLDTEG